MRLGMAPYLDFQFSMNGATMKVRLERTKNFKLIQSDELVALAAKVTDYEERGWKKRGEVLMAPSGEYGQLMILSE